MVQRLLSLETLDETLRPLLDGISLALVHHCPVVIHTSWKVVPHVALLPFHLHARWPEKIAELPLITHWTIMPFLHSDSSIIQQPLYDANEAHNARNKARYQRYTLGRFQEKDFVHPDWEEGLRKYREDLRSQNLAGCSFIAVDVVTQTGSVSRGSRPYLGSRATHNAPRPSVLVPSRVKMSDEAYKVLACSDFALINLQGIRGKSAIDQVKNVLRNRGGHLPSVIIASSPSDLMAIGWEELDLQCLHHSIYPIPDPPSITVTIVGKDRPQAEKELDFAIGELQGNSPLVDYLITLVQAAWWSGRQAIKPDQSENLAYHRFCSALEHAQNDAPAEARHFTAAKLLLAEMLDDKQIAEERTNAILDAIFRVPSGKRTLILTRHWLAAKQIKQAIAEIVGVTSEQIEAASIVCCSTNNFIPDASYEYAIACGYFGASTIDALLSSKATHVHMILDPVEASIARKHVKEMSNLFPSILKKHADVLTQSFYITLHQHILPFENSISLSFESTVSRISSSHWSSPSLALKHHKQDTILVLFVDGTQLEIPQKAHLEIIDRQRTVRLRTIQASELQPGDELIIVTDDIRSHFSSNLLKTLDEGKLHHLIEKREKWFIFLQAIKANAHLNLRAVHRNLVQKGIQVSYQTVLSWTRSASDTERTVPISWRYFKALAEELGLLLPEPYLIDIFNGIRELRMKHRLAGRNLVRAMRSAYLGRLDSSTLAHIEREWGLNTRELVQNTRLIEVDSVIA